MRKFQTWWIKFGCFLTGYDFYILSNCSEVSIRKVKKYTAALIIISVVWAFVGYSFADRYLKLDVIGCILGALIACIIVIQVERQILMVTKTNWKVLLARGLIAVLMAIIGSLIIDQIIFKEDIELRKIKFNEKKVSEQIPKQTIDLNKQIQELDTIINKKEQDKELLIKEINLNPFVKNYEMVTEMTEVAKTKVGDTTSTKYKPVSKNSYKSVPNPKTVDQLNPLKEEITKFRDQRNILSKQKAELRTSLRKTISSKTGFIDELNIMIDILKDSFIGLIVYFIWFIFLLLIELLILFSKIGDKDSDYELVIAQQMEMHQKKLKLLNSQNTSS